MESPDLFKLISGFFVSHLAADKNVSKHTAMAYRDGMRLLLKFASKTQSCPVSSLRIDHFTPPLILGFLDHLENERGNSIQTRNARLAMIHSFFGYVMAEDLRTADLCRRILRIPPKRQKRPALEYLSGDEIKQILESVDRASPNGRRDYLLLALLYDTGARVQEVLDLRPCDFRFDSPVHVRLTGKGRKERLCPLLPQTVRLVESFLKEHDRLITDSQPLFQNKRTRKLSRHGVRYILKKYLNSAAKEMPTLLRRSLSPHTFRHSKSIHLLQSGIPLVTIKDFLGHADLRTTHIYAKTDLEAKRQALQMGGSPVMVKNTPEIPADILHWLETI